jgi:hypothetical protein
MLIELALANPVRTCLWKVRRKEGSDGSRIPGLRRRTCTIGKAVIRDRDGSASCPCGKRA